MGDNGELQEYLLGKRTMVDRALSEFVSQRYRDQGGLMEMAAHLMTGGKRLRGIMSVMVCEALGAPPERALVAACAVELCHACSLVKDDIWDKDETRRGGVSFWKRFGFEMASMVPDMIVPHAAMFTATYGPRALMAVIGAWASIAKGQVRDYPKLRGGFPVAAGEYETIIGLKTAPLFECAAELGVRASGRDWLLGPAKEYGRCTGLAFQAYDDACDLVQAEGQPWEAASHGDMPVSLQALRVLVQGGNIINARDAQATLALGDLYLENAVAAARAFPDSLVREYLLELPAAGCRALLAEVSPDLASQRVGGMAPGGMPQPEGA